MKKIKKWIGLLLLSAVCAVSLPYNAVAAQAAEPTGYTKAEDVVYVKDGNKVANWGVRGETCTFLSLYAKEFYVDDTYELVSQKAGGTSTSNTSTSALYSALQGIMKENHKTTPSYGDARYLFGYTDCERSDMTTIVSFYSGESFNNKWDQGATWNREHTWPQSKSLNGSQKGGEDGDDFIILRPTLTSENASRNNKAYGESSGYYYPGDTVKGDCARIALYVYTRWGNISRMWGSDGVIENLTVLLRWMKEDPVDTWEMGRNDAVQSITGTRNVFVDYPEYAWLLFGETLPKEMTTPSGMAYSTGTPSVGEEDVPVTEFDCGKGLHNFSEWIAVTLPTETMEGVSLRTCYDCGETENLITPAKGNGSGMSSTSLLASCNATIGITSGVMGLFACAFVVLKKKRD